MMGNLQDAQFLKMIPSNLPLSWTEGDGQHALVEKQIPEGFGPSRWNRVVVILIMKDDKLGDGQKQGDELPIGHASTALPDNDVSELIQTPT